MYSGRARLTFISVCVASILRIHSLVELAHNSGDAMYYGAPPIYWAAIEMDLAISCACVPALKPLVVKIIPAFGSRQSAKDSSQGPGTSKQSKSSGLSGPFQRFGGEKHNSTVNLTQDVEQGVEDIELESVTALPPAYRPHMREIRIEIRRF